MIDPYELLGVTTESTIKELKTAFYGLSLLLHPDKGGSIDEMIVLQTSYEWIKDHLDNVEGNKKTFADLLDSYKEQQKVQSFTDIFNEVVFDNSKFNQEFEIANKSDIVDGYGIDMETFGEYRDFVDETSIIQYKEPEPVAVYPVMMGIDVSSNYSLEKPITMTDYKEAYTLRRNLIDLGIPCPEERSFEQIVEEREKTL